MEGGGFEKGHHFFLICVDMHMVLGFSLLADVKRGLQFARACRHEGQVANVEWSSNPDLTVVVPKGFRFRD